MLTMLTHVFDLITAVHTVCDSVAEGILWQTLTTATPKTSIVTCDALVAAGFVTAIRTLPAAITNTGSGQTRAVIALERFFGTASGAALILIRSVVTVLVLVTHKVPGYALPIPALKRIVMTTRVL